MPGMPDPLGMPDHRFPLRLLLPLRPSPGIWPFGFPTGQLGGQSYGIQVYISSVTWPSYWYSCASGGDCGSNGPLPQCRNVIPHL
jgi:hypothetical protein